MTIGQRISKLRKEKGLSQSQLGLHLGVSNKAVSKWETGATYPDIDLLPDLAKTLGITVDELLSKNTPTILSCNNILNWSDKMNESLALLKFNPIEDGCAYEVLKATISKEMIGEISIPETFDGKPVKRIAQKAFYMCPNIVSVKIANGIEEIGKDAFYGCKNITEITIPDSVTKIGSCAFLYCDRLITVKMSVKIKSIGYNAFAKCPLLEDVHLPHDVELGTGAFETKTLKI